MNQNLEVRILQFVKENPAGATDRQITDALLGVGESPQPVNAACRGLESKGKIRRVQKGGRIRNFPPASLEDEITKLLLEAQSMMQGPSAPGIYALRGGGIGIEGRLRNWVKKAKGLAGRLEVESVTVTVGFPWTLSLSVTVKANNKQTP